MPALILEVASHSWGINHSKQYSINIETKDFVVVENNKTLINRTLSLEEFERALDFMERLLEDLPRSGDFGFDAPTFEVYFDDKRLVKGIADSSHNNTYKLFYDFFESFVGK